MIFVGDLYNEHTPSNNDQVVDAALASPIWTPGKDAAFLRCSCNSLSQWTLKKKFELDFPY